MKKKWFVLSLTVLMVGATACRTSRPTVADGADAVPLTGTCWKLTDLSGESVRMKSADAAPYLTLESGEHSVSGYGGCNRFRGAYELGGEQEIRFSRMVITQKMCLEAGDTEDRLMDALNRTVSCVLKGDTLILYGEGAEALARFRALAQ